MTFEPHLHGSHVPRDEQGLMDEARRLAARLRQWEPNARMAGMIDPNVAIDVRRVIPELTLLRARREYLEAGLYLDWARVAPRQSAVEANGVDGPDFGERPARPDIPSEIGPAIDIDFPELSRAPSFQNARSRHAGLAERQARGRQLEDRYIGAIHTGEVGYNPSWATTVNSNDTDFSGLPSSYTRREATAGDNRDFDLSGYPLGFAQGEATADHDYHIDLLYLPYPTFHGRVAVTGRLHTRRPQRPTRRPARPRTQSPDYHAMLTCPHTNVMSGGSGLCHGCLQRRAGRQMCRACLPGFCAPCLNLSRLRSYQSITWNDGC